MVVDNARARCACRGRAHPRLRPGGPLLFGNGRALSRTARELRRLDGDDRRWLHPARILTRRPAPPVGRFNAGQKLNARLALFGLIGLYLSGIYLIVFGRAAFGHLHGPFALLTTALIVGHIFMAVVNPSTRHALRGMTLGSVNRAWAEHHHPRWVEEMDAQEATTALPGAHKRTDD